jgi:hypothetical protein
LEAERVASKEPSYGVFSKEFAIEPNANYAVTLTGRVPYGAGTVALAPGAVLSCGNAKSKMEVRLVAVSSSTSG